MNELRIIMVAKMNTILQLMGKPRISDETIVYMVESMPESQLVEIFEGAIRTHVLFEMKQGGMQ